MEDRVIMFFKKWDIYDKNLNNMTIINTIDKDIADMEMIFEFFFKEFNIKNSSSFLMDKYFYNFSFLKQLMIKFGFKINIEMKRPITIQHMLNVAKKKEWFDPQ